MRFGKEQTNRVKTTHYDFQRCNSLALSSSSLKLDRTMQHSTHLQSQVRGLFRKNNSRHSQAQSPPQLNSHTSLSKKPNYRGRHNPPEPHEHPLRSLQLDSLSELNLFSNENSVEYAYRHEYDQGETEVTPTGLHFRDAVGQNLEIYSHRKQEKNTENKLSIPDFNYFTGGDKENNQYVRSLERH